MIHDTGRFTRCQICNCETIRHCVMRVGNVTTCLESPDMVCVDLSGLYPNAKRQKLFPRYRYPFPLIAWSQEWWLAERTDSSGLETRGRYGILHIVKVFPLPDPYLTADKIHGLSRGVQDLTLTFPGSCGSCFNWSSYLNLWTTRTSFTCSPCRLLHARQEKLDKSKGQWLLSTKDKIFILYSKHPVLHGNEANNLQVRRWYSFTKLKIQ